MGCANSKKDVDVVNARDADSKQQETCTAPSVQAKAEPEVMQAAAPSQDKANEARAAEDPPAVDPPAAPLDAAEASATSATASAAAAPAAGQVSAEEARVEAVAVSIETPHQQKQSIDAESGAAAKIQAVQRGKSERKRQTSVSREPTVSVKQAVARGNSFTPSVAPPMPSSHDRERAISMTGRGGSHGPISPPRSPSAVSTASSVPVSPALVATGGRGSGPPSPMASDGSEDEGKEPKGTRGSEVDGLQREGRAVAKKVIERALVEDAAAKTAEKTAQKAAERVAQSAFGKSLSTVSVEGSRPAVSMVAHFVPSPTKPSTPGGRGGSKRDERLTGESMASDVAAEEEVDADNEWLAAHLSLTRSMSSHGKQVRSASKGKKKGSKRGSAHGARPSPSAMTALTAGA